MFTRQTVTYSEKLQATLEAKWGKEMMREGFVPFPKRLLRCLSAIFPKSPRIKELQVALAIADYLRVDLNQGPSIGYLGFLTGLSEDEVSKALQQLQTNRLIEMAGTGDRQQISNAGLRKKVMKLTKEDEVD